METTAQMPTIDYIRKGRPAKDIEHVGQTYSFAKPIPRITCEDGFSLSVHAGAFLYSTPRSNHGPWTHVEVGFPSARPEPWDAWAEYVEEADKPTETVYSYVPVDLVADLITAHGGEATR